MFIDYSLHAEKCKSSQTPLPHLFWNMYLKENDQVSADSATVIVINWRRCNVSVCVCVGGGGAC